MKQPKDATMHTAVIGTVVEMWEKLAWDIDIFEDIQRRYPDETQPLAYAAINVCIAAASLGDWVLKTIEPQFSAESASRIRDQIAAQVPELNMCRAIANTAKHLEYKESRWAGGRVDLVWEEGDEYGPPGYALYHVHNDGQSMTLAFNSFQALKEAWWKTLVAEGLATGQMPSPKWMQNKLTRIFGPAPELPPPYGVEETGTIFPSAV
jgi:hypothetical protein